METAGAERYSFDAETVSFALRSSPHTQPKVIHTPVCLSKQLDTPYLDLST